MAWIESHQSLQRHPKLTRAARHLGISRIELIGHLHCLWWWALEYAQDGSLAAYQPADIADAAEWKGDADTLVYALSEAARIGDKEGFLERRADGTFLVHDWWDYAGKLIDKRKADAERKRDSRRQDDAKKENGCPTDVQRMSDGRSADGACTVPYRTVPDSTTPTEPTEPNNSEQLQLSPAWAAFTKARGVNVNPTDSQYIGELESLYGSDAVAQAIYYCDTHKKNNYLAVSYITKMLSVWQGEGSLGMHPPGPNGNGASQYPTPKKRKQLVYDADSNLVEVEVDA